MFCSQCGKKLDEGAVFCSGCGYKLGDIPVNNTTTSTSTPGKGKSVASLVLGIFGVLLGLLYLIACLEIEQSSLVQISESYAFRFGYALGSVLLPIICAIIGVCLSASARKQKKTGLNTAGLVLSIITFVLCGIIALIVFTV
ncbi:MAG: zinc ribbon domain-containing protein [Firmicutes bacterium]|nr:zinc ribbon domain-containing protein [Bacillota bacterium]